MKSLITITAALTMWLISTVNAQSQEKDPETPTQTVVEKFSKLKEKIIQEEKDALKAEVENINKRVENGNLDEAEAETLKKAAAEKHAFNIENRVAIVDNKMALLQRNGEIEENEDKSYFAISLGNEDADNTRVFEVSVKGKEKGVVYDRRTSSAPVFAFGLNNVITKGESLEDFDFKVASSRFVELGWAWKTRVFKNNNWLRVKYGLSFQFNGLKPTDNRIYVDTGEQTELQTFSSKLDKSKFRMDNLVIPIHFEFGPSRKNETEKYFRYSTDSHFKVGLGGYGGINLSARQKLKFEEDGKNQKEKLKSDYNTNNFTYGLSAYIGWGATTLYAKYDLNTIFKNNAVAQRNASLGVRFDLD